MEEETVSENDLDGNADAALMAADEGMETYAVGDTFWDEGSHLWYRVTGDGEVEVKGEDPNWDNKVANAIVPESLVKDGVTYRVTGIGANAFGKYGALKTISIPASVKRIGDSAFSCSALSGVTIPEGVTEIGSSAFSYCPLKSITIPGSVRSMGSDVFACAEGLKSVTIKEGVTSIADYTFEYCRSLTKVEIPASVTSIGDSAFSMCSSLRSVTLPASVTEIKECAFASSGLTSIEIPQGVTKIEVAVFEGCNQLASVTLPEGITNIRKNAFFRCENLTAIEIPQNVKQIGEAAFYKCEKLTSVEIPQGVTRIENFTFASCTSLNNMEIPGNVTSIGDHAFEDCDSLTSVTISEKISKIGVEAFKNCDQLKALNIVVSSDENIRFPQVGRNAFVPFPGNNMANWRYIHFFGTYDTSKDELRGQAYSDAFTDAAKNDGDSDNGRWYGWSYEGVTIDTYNVTIDVRKDTIPWTDHNRAFALTKDNAAAFTTDLDAVEPGTYEIYDVTGVSSVDEYGAKGMNTGVSVEVTNADTSATVDYYTATFYDIGAGGSEIAYGDSTDQKPQTILKTVGRVTKPVTDPAKAGHTFEKWVTAPDGDDEFNFASAEITAPTKIYAKWKVNIAPTYTVTINVKKDNTPWSNHGRTFALLGGGTSGFLEVPGQAGDSSYCISQVPDGTYRIYDITGVPADSLYSRARDTGAEMRVSGADTEVDVTVNGADEEKDVHYYTATFYDGTEAYKAGTPQEPQIILRGKKAAKPEDPQKADWQFAGWKTTDGGATAYDFDGAVTDTTSIFASWVEKTAEQLHITADATEGGTIDPTGDIVVTKGGEQSITITPNEGYKIKAVTVDGKDVTAGLKDTLARAQAGARYYTFTNVTENHTIHAAFEADSGDKPGEGDDDKPDDGDDKPDDGGDDKPDDGGDKPDPGDDTPDGGGDNSEPDGDTPGGETGTAQVTVVSQTSSPQALDGAGSSEGAPDTSAAGRTANGREPKTGDADYVEVYATLAMIAGLTYLLLYFMEEGHGMTEREKEVFVAAFIRWAKKGGRFRKCCAIAAIFCLLVYYHSIGKRAGRAGFDRECLRQAL